jgi:L-seryl-tRNA(Ser) seleniumtransferase
MSVPPLIADRLRRLPKVDELLGAPGLAEALARHPRGLVVDAVRDAVESVRGEILKADGGTAVEPSAALVAARALRILAAAEVPGLRKCLNGTGVILHTNLGRAPLPDEAVQAVREVAGGYSNLEFDLATGERGSRTATIERLLAEITGAPAAAVCNNNAAATLLLLNTLAAGREVIVSRGQLVEIGGSFRLPEVMERSGCVLREVGTTNRTRIADFERAINERTAALMRVHTSNYAVVGFTEQPTLTELVELAGRRGLKMIDDVGSGLLRRDLWSGSKPAGFAADEPVVAESLAAGADVVCFSGDKLLGGPQAGILVGKKETIQPIRKNPLMRALRVGKLTLAALEAVLRLYRDPESARAKVPFWRMATESEAVVRARAEKLAGAIAALCPDLDCVLAESTAYAGGGSLPGEQIESWSAAVDPRPMSCDDFAAKLRGLRVPLLGRINRGRFVLDARTLADGELAAVAEAVRAVRAP